MALSFSFPTGKVKKGDSFNTTRNLTNKDLKIEINHEGLIEKSNKPKGQGPKSWKSFPSLIFFKESTANTNTQNTNTANNIKSDKVISNTTRTITGSKLPVRTPTASSYTCNTKSSKSSNLDKNTSKSILSIVNKKVEGLFHLNLSRSNSTEEKVQLSGGKSLPDVTDTESPKPLSIFKSEKPCDLLAQIQSLNKSIDFDPCNILLKNVLDNPNQMEGDIVNRESSFDTNGNPCVPNILHPNPIHEEIPPNPIAFEEAEFDMQEQKEEEGREEKVEQSDIQDGQQLSTQNYQFNKASENPKEIHSSNISSNNSISTSRELNRYDLETNEDNDEPKYFINAAALSEDDTFVLTPSSIPSTCTLEFSTTMKSCETVSKVQKEFRVEDVVSFENNQPTLKIDSSAPTNTKKEVSVIRPRVPISKSYPDIIQTTFNSDEKDNDFLKRTLTKENSDLESLVADSLENLSVMDPNTKSQMEKSDQLSFNPSDLRSIGDKPFKAFDKALQSSQQSGLMSGSSMMSESQMGGLFAEKPPEAWVIDFNSLSMESEIENASYRKSESGGSNSNSLAFFVNIDDCKGERMPDRERRNSEDSNSTSGEKKIFSMFVDMRESEGVTPSSSKGPSTSQLRKPVVNKSVMNVMETSTGSIKSMNKKFPSPIFQHKAAAEAARQSARLEWEKQREKYFDSLEPNSILMGLPNISNDKGSMGESTVSNRSSLHVANVLESSFSSSFISSMENSQPTEMEICQGVHVLGKDLLRMFQEGINTDVNINVNGRWIKAHKCILASRSQYFAAILSGHWVEKAGNTINLDGFSYSVVQFTLYHIYSGTNEIPDTIDLMELATLTDLLGLEGLRENISQTFRVKFCHNFHRPCTGCITGVLECFPIAGDYGMDELHRKMIKWICKHFVRIWPTKGFASLGDEQVDKCLRYSVNHLSTDNILDHTLGCDQLLSTMPTLRWTEAIFSIVNQLAAECVQFLGEHLSDVLQSQKFLQFGKGQAWNISRIEGTFVQSLLLLKPDIACLSHTALSRLIELGTLSIDEVEWSTSFIDFIKMLKDEVERFLLANASKAVLSRCWEQLGQDIRKKICNTSFVGFDKFGNKIAKNTSGGTSSGRNSSRPSSTSKQSHSSTTKSKQSSNNTMTKVASVRPMQSQHPHESAVTLANSIQTLSIKKSFSTATSSRPSSASKSDRTIDLPNPNVSSDTRTVTPRNTLRANPKKAMSIDREKSFNSTNSHRTSGSTAFSSVSANRTPMIPSTPSVPPTKPSPLSAGYDQGGNSSISNNTTTKPSTVRASSGVRNQRKEPKPSEPPKKQFLSNSAKAAAVSKPILKTVSKNSSFSSLNSQQGATTTIASSNIHNIHKSNPRYSSTTTNTFSLSVKPAIAGFSTRSSFSNVERPTIVKSKVDSNPPRRNTVGQNQGHTTIPNKVRRPVSSGNPIVRGTLKHPGVTESTGHSSMPPVSIPSVTSFDFDSLNDSYTKDNAMSRSTIETESGEVKIRSLSEIGRSNTFSKDEPTILGKMDGSGYGNFEIDYEEYE